MKAILYEHVVQYYETDQMKCVHHSNYIRWFEEARTCLMDKLNFSYARMEEMQVVSPVLEAKARYRSMTRFGETVVIETVILAYTGVKIRFGYKVKNKETDELRCEGETEHCFLNPQGRPAALKKVCPTYHEAVLCALEKATCTE